MKPLDEHLMTDEEYLRALGWVRGLGEYWEHGNEPVRWDDDSALDIEASRDALLGRRVRETMILAGLGPDSDIPDPETVRAMVEIIAASKALWGDAERVHRLARFRSYASDSDVIGQLAVVVLSLNAVMGE